MNILTGRFKNYSMHLCLKADIKGILWNLNIDSNKTITLNVLDIDTLDLPRDLICELKCWHNVYKKYSKDWDKEHLDKLDSIFKREFYNYGLGLAKRLKLHYRADAYVEYECYKETCEMWLYHIRADCGVYLWDDKWFALCLESLEDEDELGIKITQAMLDLDKKLESWSDTFFENICYKVITGKENEINKIEYKKLLKKGEKLSKKLQKLMPKNCIIEYSRYIVDV